MAARAAIALSLAALAWAGGAQAQDNPACVQYREPMAYNACLARHGPKANGVGWLPQPSHAGHDRVWHGQRHHRTPTTRFYSPHAVHRGRVHMEFRVR
jgi:hypothetical protein